MIYTFGADKRKNMPPCKSFTISANCVVRTFGMMVSVGASVGRSGEGRPTDPDFSHKTDRQRNKSWLRPCLLATSRGRSRRKFIESLPRRRSLSRRGSCGERLGVVCSRPNMRQRAVPPFANRKNAARGPRRSSRTLANVLHRRRRDFRRQELIRHCPSPSLCTCASSPLSSKSGGGDSV